MTLTPQHPTKKYQVLGIGNAIVDVLTRSDDSFLEMMGIEKGIMQLVERERAEQLYGAMENRVQAAGGSVANTRGLAISGCARAFSGACATMLWGGSTRMRWRRAAPISSTRRSRAVSCRPRAR